MNLKNVLDNSSDAHERAIAAQLLGYAKDKQAVVPYLIAAMRDADSDVRNNASRALVVFAEYAPNPPGQKINVPAQPFIRMLKSCVWSDRNKSAAALAQLSATRSPAILAEVREQALPELFEMAAWKYLGHASYSLEILGRLAGLSDEEIQNDLARGDRMAIVAAAKAMAAH
jgi:HEAT repeat protein